MIISQVKIKCKGMRFYCGNEVINNEYSHLNCRAIDIDNSITLKELITEIESEEPTYLIAYRNQKRYVEKLLPLYFDDNSHDSSFLQQEGAIVITGGTGGLGLEAAFYLAKQSNVNIALLNRTAMPERIEWETLLAEREEERLCQKIEKLLNIEKTGAKVTCFTVDVGNEIALKDTLDDVRRQFGFISGIVHCAGVAGDGYLMNKSKDTFDDVLKPKMEGTWLLHEYTKRDNVQFFILFSSITSLIGSAGQGDYTAANAFLDSFAGLARSQGTPACVINWPAWKETGMAADYGVNNQAGIFQSISTKRGVIIFEKTLQNMPLQVIIPEIDWNVVQKSNYTFPFELSNKIQRKITNDHRHYTDQSLTPQRFITQVELSGDIPKSNDETETMKRIANVWGYVLGQQHIDIHANFDSLGGNSIMATQLIKELDKEFPTILDISDIYVYPTISKMSQFVHAKIASHHVEKINGNGNGSYVNIDDVLDRLSKGEISSEEADELVAQL